MARTIMPFSFPIFASTARTATVNSNAYINSDGYRGVRLFIDVTLDAALASVVFSLEIKDPISGDWKTLIDSAAVVAVTTGPTFLETYPGCVAVANSVANRAIGKQFRVTATHADADAMTYSVGAEWLV